MFRAYYSSDGVLADAGVKKLLLKHDKSGKNVVANKLFIDPNAVPVGREPDTITLSLVGEVQPVRTPSLIGTHS